MSTLLITPPVCMPNYVYPGAGYLTRFLRRQGQPVAQVDLNLEFFLRLWSRPGLERIFAEAEKVQDQLSEDSLRILQNKERYLLTIEPLLGFLQGRQPDLALFISQNDFLPRGPKFDGLKGEQPLGSTDLTPAVRDRAKCYGTLYLYDLAELVREAVFPFFQMPVGAQMFESYMEPNGSFDEMQEELERPPNVLDEMLEQALAAHIETYAPDLIGVTIPFGQNLYWALRIGRIAKQLRPQVKVAMGGGFVSTCMRSVRESRLFSYFDFLSLDDGEKPLLYLIEHIGGRRALTELCRTFYYDDKNGGTIEYMPGDPGPAIPPEETGAPDYTDYRLADYYTTFETSNVITRLWYEQWWNKLTMAHGCYWRKCAFCDIHLSYVADYSPFSGKDLVDKVEELIAQTGVHGFHFVDEAMPPRVMKAFALEVLRRKLQITWYGMLRFDKSFTPEFCRLLAASGLVAVYGGIEVASDRLLKLMKKGISVEQIVVVTQNFQSAGIGVHGFIMYGFPTQTAQETIDALDVLRQLFKHRLLTAGSWNKFVVTSHSPIARNPQDYVIVVLPESPNAFFDQMRRHVDPMGCNHDRFGIGLAVALNYYCLGLYHDVPSERWFNFPVPAVSIDRELVAKILTRHAGLWAPDANATSALRTD